MISITSYLLNTELFSLTGGQQSNFSPHSEPAFLLPLRQLGKVEATKCSSESFLRPLVPDNVVIWKISINFHLSISRD